MCAINGITKNDAGGVAFMNERTAHRGPDGSRVWEGDGITLGHNRLAIIDLSDRALQPMESTDGRYVIVFNGEIYNYQELRVELQDAYNFKTESDTEVLMAAYARFGEAVLSKLRGIFAFGIWDKKERSLVLARDHMGVKPLYYRFSNGVLSFSSELCGLMNAKPVLSSHAFALYTEFQYAPSDETLVCGINKLRPGHLIRYVNGEMKEAAYYDPILGIGIPERKEKSQGINVNKELVDTIDTAVKRQLVSDRPVGMFLSGGIDSSIVLHHASKYTPHMRTFSVDFEMVHGAEGESTKFNTDAALAVQTAHQYGAKHTTYTLTINDIRSNLETAIQALDEPVANPTAISQYLLSKFVRNEGVVVALGGDGGDELFGGYTRHRMAMAAYQYQKLPEILRIGIGKLSTKSQKLNTPLLAPMHRMLMADKVALAHNIFTKDLKLEETARSFLTSAYARAKNDVHPVDTFMKVDRETWLPDESLARSDRSSMAHGLELRVPLLDLDVVAYADTLSVYTKTDPFTGKKVLRNAYRELLPEYLFNQPKRGWISPGAKWLRDPEILRFVEDVLSPQYYDGIKLFNWPVIQALLHDHVERRGYYLYPLWNIIVAQIWARKNGVISEQCNI